MFIEKDFLITSQDTRNIMSIKSMKVNCRFFFFPINMVIMQTHEVEAVLEPFNTQPCKLWSLHLKNMQFITLLFVYNIK